MRKHSDSMARSNSTRERILDVAERLFAEHGFAGTSMRAITTEAEVNLALVNYHYGTKEDLFRAVVRRVVGPVNEEQVRRLEAGSSGKEPTVEELLEALVGPVVALLGERWGQEGSSIRLLKRIVFGPDDESSRLSMDVVGDTDIRYLEAFSRALPHLSAAELEVRYRAALVVITLQLMTALSGPEGDAETIGRQQAWIIAFLAAGLRAPSAGRGD